MPYLNFFSMQDLIEYEIALHPNNPKKATKHINRHYMDLRRMG